MAGKYDNPRYVDSCVYSAARRHYFVAIGSGLVAMGGMFASHRLPGTSALFLSTTVLTSVTGFLFPIHGFTPALGVGIVSCVILAVALLAYYGKHLIGPCRWIYV